VAGLTGLGMLRRLRGGKSMGQGESRSSSGFNILRKVSDLLLFPDSYAGWAGPAARKGRELIARGDIDLIYSTGPPDTVHRVGQRLARESGLPWVADFRDLWYNLHLKPPPSNWHRRRHERAEAQVLHNANVVTVTEGWRKLLEERGGRPVTLIRNGFDPADFEGIETPTDPEREFVMLHTGKLSLDRSALPFLKGLRKFLDIRPDLEDKLRVDFLGPRESENESVLEELRLTNQVRFTGSLPHREALRRQRAADLLLILHQGEERYRDLVPGKCYEYAGAGRPVLALAPEGELSGLVNEFKLGWSVRPQADEVARALDEALSQITRGWKPTPGKLEALTRPWQAARMADLFTGLVQGKESS
jgi:glycosyltransferase involved in cell wall biosynthesis